MIRLCIALICCVFFAVALVSCGEADTTPSPTPGDSERFGWPATIRIGLVPAEGGTDIVERLSPLLGHLESTLGVPVEAFSASEYIGIITAMQNDQVDVAYLGPKSYVEAERIAGAVAIAKQLNTDGEPGYYGIIVTNASTGITELAQARGRTFGFVTPNSTSGFLVPSIGIVETVGEPAESFFGEIRYTGSHGNAVRAVLAGDLEVAATNTLDLKAMEAAGLDASGLVELWRSELIPGALFAVRDDLPPSFGAAVADAIVSFSSDAAAMQEMSRGGYVHADDSEYDVIRVLEERRSELVGDGG
ncbi:MAG: phosphate/phosphite/phosphonate ABC transporter substrate-binding protein [Planctomycetota bacterium]